MRTDKIDNPLPHGEKKRKQTSEKAAVSPCECHYLKTGKRTAIGHVVSRTHPRQSQKMINKAALRIQNRAGFMKIRGIFN
jgi:hypothetical protein